MIIPWHFHETEEVIVVLEGNGECRTDEGAENYSAGDVIIFPPRVKHSLKNSGDTLIRQICFFPSDPATKVLPVKRLTSSTRASGPNQSRSAFHRHY